MRYEIQTLFANGEWQNPNGETFGTLYDVETEFIALMEAGNLLQDFNANDWRVDECEQNGEDDPY